MNKLKKYMYQSGGLSDNLTIVEDGEYIRDNQGKVGKITNIPTHDDNELIIDNQVKSVTKGKGGQGIYNVESVLSASHENRKQSDDTYTYADEEIKIKPQEALQLAEQLNLKIKRPLGSISPSKLMDKLLESREKLVSKYKDIDKPLKSERQTNSFTANVDVLSSIPTPEDIYDFVFTNQENSKSVNEDIYAKTGIHIDPSKRGTFKAAASRYGMSMDALATDAKQNPEKYSGILRKKANFYRNFAMQTGGTTDSNLYYEGKYDPFGNWRKLGEKQKAYEKQIQSDKEFNNSQTSVKGLSNGYDFNTLKGLAEGYGLENINSEEDLKRIVNSAKSTGWSFPSKFTEEVEKLNVIKPVIKQEVVTPEVKDDLLNLENIKIDEIKDSRNLFNNGISNTEDETNFFDLSEKGTKGEFKKRFFVKKGISLKDQIEEARKYLREYSNFQTGGKIDAKDALGRTYSKNDDGSYTLNGSEQKYEYNPKSKTFNVFYDNKSFPEVKKINFGNKISKKSITEENYENLNSESYNKNKSVNDLLDTDFSIYDPNVLEYLKRKHGNPKVNFDKNLKRGNIKYFDNEINVGDLESTLAELAHSTNTLKQNYFDITSNKIKDFIKSPYYNQETYDKGFLWGDGQYETEGTEEYNAHKVREPLIKKEYQDIIKKKYKIKQTGGNTNLEIEDLEYQTGGKNVIHNGKPMYQRKDGKIVKRGIWSNTYLSKKQIGGRLQQFPTMYGSKPVALVNTSQGVKRVNMIDNRTISMDDMFNKDSVQIQGNKAVIIKKNPLKKFIK